MFFLAVCFVSLAWATSLLAEERLPLRPEACLMPPPEGDCGGAQQNRWFFDAGTGSCKQFVFLGCPGVGINFETQEECHRICVHAAAEDDLQPQPEVQRSGGTPSTFQVDPAESDQHNAERTMTGLLGTTEEITDTIGRVTQDMTSPPPLPPSEIQKKLSGSAEVEVTRVAESPNQRASNKTTHPLAPEKDQEDEQNTSVRVKDFDEGPMTSLLTPEMPREPLAINDQPIPSSPDSGNAEEGRDSATPLMAIQRQPEPPAEAPTTDDDQESVVERSQPLTDQDDDDDDDDRNIEEPEAGALDPHTQTELEDEVGQVPPKEATNEKESRENEPDENPSSETPRVMPSNGEVGITSAPTTSMLSNAEERQRNVTPKLASLVGNAEMERVQQEDSDRREPQDDMREMSTVKKTEQTTRNQEDSENRRIVDHQVITEKSQPEVVEISTVRTVPIEPRRSGLGVPVIRSPARMKSPVGSRRTGSDGLSQDDSKPEDHATVKEGKRNIGVTHQIPEALPLLKSLPHLASGEESKAPRTIATNSSHRGADSRNAAQPPAANGPPVATTFSMDGMIKNRESPPTGGNTRITSGNLGVRSKIDVPAMRLLKSETDYRRPTFCSLHRVRGHCTEHLHRWFFNPFNGSCQSFTYSGCGGNPNNFETMDACFETCAGRNSDRSRRQNNFGEDASNLRVPTRFGEPNWLPVSASLAGPPPAPQSAGLQLFLDILRRKLPTPPSPPSFLRSLAFPVLRSGGGPGDNVAEQKMLLRDSDVEESGKREEQQHRAKQSVESSEKRSHLMGKASGSEQHEKLQIPNELQPTMTQRSRSSEELRAPPNQQPELEMVENDVATLRHLLQQDLRESRDSVFNPLERYPETSSAQKSRYPDARKADDTRTNRRGEMEQTRYEERIPVVQRARSRQNRQSPAIGFQRFGHFVNSGRPIPPELKNFRWIEQAIVMSDLAPGRFNLPLWFGDEMMGKGRPPSQTVSKWRGSPGLRPDSGNPQNALTLRRNSMILETRQHAEKLQDLEIERRLASRASYSANGLVPLAMKPSIMEISLDRGFPHQSLKQRQSSFSTSPTDSFPARGKGNVEIPFHVLRLTRPLVEQTAGRTGAGRVEQDSRRLSHADADARRNGGRDDVRAKRPDVVGGRDENRQEQVKERTVQRRRNNNGFSNRFPNDRLTFLQIFVNRDEVGPANQPHFPSPSREENQYLNRQGLSLSRSHIDRPRFQTDQNNGYLPPPPPPPPRQMSPRQRPVQISRETMTEERDWLPASEFDGPRPNGEFVNSRSGFFGSVPNEDPRDTRGSSINVVCQLPLEPGSCAGYQAKWYYNNRKGSCELFYYGGCAGNGNRFDTRDECLQTCDGGSDLNTDEAGQSRSLGGTFGPQTSEISSEDDVIVLTSPVYGGEFEENVKDFATVKAKYAGHDHVIRPEMTTHAPFLSGHGKRVELESNAPLDVEVESKDIEGTTIANAAGKSAITESTGKGGDAGAKKDEDLSKTFSTQYIAIVTALGVVGIAVVLMVILSIVRLCRRVKKSKREHCIQEVIKSHMYGDLPHVLYSESPSSVVSEKEKSDQT